MINTAEEALKLTLSSNARREMFVSQGLKDVEEAAKLGRFEAWISVPDREEEAVKGFKNIFKEKGFGVGKGMDAGKIIIHWDGEY